jgi:cell division transport system permease protein
MTGTTARVLDTARDGRTMAGVLAIMLFLTVLAAAGGIGAARGAAALRIALGGRATVQIVTADATTRAVLAARVLATLRASPAVRQATPVPAAELARLLGPWLGDAATSADLPVPALVDIELAPRPGSLAQVRAALAAVTPAARLDTHADALAGTGTLLATLTALAAVTVALMIAGSAAVVLLAIHAGLVAHRITIEVLHGLGATDAQVAQLFQRRIARDASVGAAAGAVAAWGVILLFARLAAGVGSQLLDGVSLGQSGWIAVVALPFAFVGFAAAVAHVAVVRALGRVA